MPDWLELLRKSAFGGALGVALFTLAWILLLQIGLIDKALDFNLSSQLGFALGVGVQGLIVAIFGSKNKRERQMNDLISQIEREKRAMDAFLEIEKKKAKVEEEERRKLFNKRLREIDTLEKNSVITPTEAKALRRRLVGERFTDDNFELPKIEETSEESEPDEFKDKLDLPPLDDRDNPLPPPDDNEESLD